MLLCLKTEKVQCGFSVTVSHSLSVRGSNKINQSDFVELKLEMSETVRVCRHLGQ